MEEESKEKKKNGKLLIVVIAFIVIIMLVAAVAYVFLNKDKGNNTTLTNTSELSNVVPTIELSYNKGNDQTQVVIEVSAKIQDGLEIKYIKLPNGNSVEGNFASYTATENGSYTFTAVASNDKEASQTAQIDNIKKVSSAEPYIPEGFTYKEGDVNTGYVIEDTYGNQFVWVPVESGKITRQQEGNTEYIEQDSSASSFVNSVAKNYGFYIARYEASEEIYVKEVEMPVNQNVVNETNTAQNSNTLENIVTDTQDTTTQKVTEKRVRIIKGKTPWSYITYRDAAKYAQNMKDEYQYKGVTTAIVNSYALDATLEWINKNKDNYSTSISYGNYSGSIRETGKTDSDIACNIYDLAGNVREWTTEIYTSSKGSEISEDGKTVKEVLYRTLRGGSANVNKNAASRIGYAENVSDQYWGFRVILFK